MLHRIAVSMRDRMIANGVMAPSVEIILYALNIVGNTVSIFSISALVGLITGELVRTLLLMMVFALIRILSGGYHLKSGMWCIVVSSALMSVLPHLRLTNTWTYVFTGIALLAILIFAPANYDKYARLSERYYPFLKLISAAIVAANLLIVSDVAAIAFITQALLLPFKEGGEEE